LPNLTIKRIKNRMDNLFQLLIFLFVIYTIFNAVMGKKKQVPKQNRMPQENMGEVETDTSPRSQDSSAEILQDLFGFKIPRTGDEFENIPAEQYPSNYQTDYQNVEETPLGQTDIPDIDYDNLPSIEYQNNLAVPEELTSAYDISQKVNQRTVDIKQRIREPNSLKELIVISEILGKPKALRR